MLSRLQQSFLQRTCLQSLQASIHTACALLEGGAEATGGTSRRQSGSRSGGDGGAKLQRSQWDRRGSDGGMSPRGGGPRQDRRGGGGSRGGGGPKRDQQGGQRRPKGQGGDASNLLNAVLGPSRPGDAQGAAGAIEQALGPLALNRDLLGLAGYVVRPDEAARFRDGRMSGDDRRRLVSKLQNIMFRSPERVGRMADVEARLEANPNYRLEDALAGPPAAGGPSPEELLERHKSDFCKLLGISEEQFEEHKAAAVAEFAAEVAPMLDEADPRAQEAQLAAVLVAVPKNHANYAQIEEKLAVLRNNPYWPHERKMVLARRLVRTML